MAPVHFIPTVDVEIFGDGSGCVQGCVVDPTRALLDVAERHGARLTLFVDALGFSVMDRATPEEVKPLRDLLAEALGRGHPLALHLHPQWSGATHTAAGWQVDPDGWRLGGRDPVEVGELVARAHAWLAEVAQSVDVDWTCPAFRAGALAVSPSTGLGAALASVGIAVDSSVAPGRVARGAGAHDFRKVPSERWWRWTDAVTQADGGPRFEVPIATSEVGALSELGSLVRRRSRSRFAHTCRPGPTATPWWKLGHLGTLMLDVCAHSAPELIALAQDWAVGPGPLPVCATGHSKNATPEALEALEGLLAWVHQQPGWQFSSYDDWRAALSS